VILDHYALRKMYNVWLKLNWSLINPYSQKQIFKRQIRELSISSIFLKKEDYFHVLMEILQCRLKEHFDFLSNYSFEIIVLLLFIQFMPFSSL
jgi:hypothetical protein